ncbi:hypothetical protein ACQY0O_001676 [Thecaphora frezii]
MQPSPSRKRTIDQVSPSNPGYASALPIPTAFSPATMGGAFSGAASVGAAAGASPMGADSPFTSALNHGSRILSGISAPTPVAATGYDPRGLSYAQAQSPAHQMQMQMQMQQLQAQNGGLPMDLALQHMAQLQRQLAQPQPQRPQQVPPQVALKQSVQELLNSLLPALERDGDAFYDAIDSALGPNADSRHVQAKRNQLLSSLSNLTHFLQTNGLASLPLTESPSDEGGATDAPASADPSTALAKETARLQELAREMFERRARLREAASIITGILNDDAVDGDLSNRFRKGAEKGQTRKISALPGTSVATRAATPARSSVMGGTPNPAATSAAATPAAGPR